MSFRLENNPFSNVRHVFLHIWRNQPGPLLYTTLWLWQPTWAFQIPLIFYKTQWLARNLLCSDSILYIIRIYCLLSLESKMATSVSSVHIASTYTLSVPRDMGYLQRESERSLGYVVFVLPILEGGRDTMRLWCVLCREYRFQCPQLICSQPYSDKFGDFPRRLIFPLASTFLYGYLLWDKNRPGIWWPFCPDIFLLKALEDKQKRGAWPHNMVQIGFMDYSRTEDKENNRGRYSYM